MTTSKDNEEKAAVVAWLDHQEDEGEENTLFLEREREKGEGLFSSQLISDFIGPAVTLAMIKADLSFYCVALLIYLHRFDERELSMVLEKQFDHSINLPCDQRKDTGEASARRLKGEQDEHLYSAVLCSTRFHHRSAEDQRCVDRHCSTRLISSLLSNRSRQTNLWLDSAACGWCVSSVSTWAKNQKSINIWWWTKFTSVLIFDNKKRKRLIKTFDLKIDLWRKDEKDKQNQMNQLDTRFEHRNASSGISGVSILLHLSCS